MIDFEPVVYPADHPSYIMANELIARYVERSHALSERPSIYLLARSPVSPVSKMIWSHLPNLAAQNCQVFVIFHKRQHTGSARRAAQMYQDAFGDLVHSHLRLADFREIGALYEELQMGQTVAWAGGRMSDDGLDVSHGDLSEGVTEGQLEMFKATFKDIWTASDSFSEAVGMKPASRGKWLRGLRATG
jgi:hypothetical protein